jgi:branched-chain amino acid transport system permease protein
MGAVRQLRSAVPLQLRLQGAKRDLFVVGIVLVASTILLGLVQGITILQFLINGVVVGSIYIVGATGLTLIYGIRKFANFAHGAMMSFGAYMAFLVNGLLLFDLLWGFTLAVVMTAVLGITMELLVFRKLALRGPVSMLVASIGVAIFLDNLLNITFGTSINQYRLTLVPNMVLFTFNGAVLSINPIRGIATLVAAIAMIVFLHLLLRATTIGKAMRATSDNPDLARASGIRINRVVLFTWALSGALAGIAGVLLGLVIDIRPGLGFSVLLFVFAAVIVGGLGSPYGAMLGGLIVGIVENLATAFLSWLGRPDVIGLEQPTAFRPIAAFVIMILVLLIRPGGLATPRAAAEVRTGTIRSRLVGVLKTLTNAVAPNRGVGRR